MGKNDLIKLKEKLPTLTTKEKIEYYNELKEYYKKNKYNTSYIEFTKIIRPIYLQIVKILRPKKLFVEYDEEITDEPAIYVCNHTCSRDVPTVSEVIKKPYILLASDEVKYNIGGLLFYLNSVIWVHRQSKESCAHASENICMALSSGNSVLEFPEGTWNTDKCLLMLELYYGAVCHAKKMQVPIVPIAIEYTNTGYYAKVGKKINIEIDSNIEEARKELRDTMAKLRYELLEKYCQGKRQEIPSNWYEEYLKRISNELCPMDLDYERERQYKNPSIITEEEVFACMDNVKITKENAYVLAKTKNKNL